MHIQLRNIGMIREADVRIDGLTVIAGENDTGKSTVGKVLFALIKADMISLLKHLRGQSKNFNENRKKNLDTQISLLFKQQLSEDGNIELQTENYKYVVKIKNNTTLKFDSSSAQSETEYQRAFKDAIFIQTPFVWDFFETFRGIANLKTESELLGISTQIPFPYLLWDTYVKLTNEKENEEDYEQYVNEIEEIIGGRFKKDSRGNFKFYRENKEFELINVAAGIRLFGLLQVLLSNTQIHNKRIIIFDEPEVHLHPKWQLKMAEIIVALVKNGVKIIVNSHSPYMVEALQRYGEREEVTADFYLAEDRYIRKVNNSNEETLSEIFRKLSEPFDVFEEMEMTRLLNG